MTPFFDGFVRARRTEIERVTERPATAEFAPGRGVRYRVGRRLVELGAHMMGPRTPVVVMEADGIRRAA